MSTLCCIISAQNNNPDNGDDSDGGVDGGVDDNQDTQPLSGPMLAILGSCMAIFIVGMVFLKFSVLQKCTGKQRPRIWSPSSDMDVERNSGEPEDSESNSHQVRDQEAQTHLSTPLAVNSS